MTTPWTNLQTAEVTLDNTQVGLGFVSHAKLQGQDLAYEMDVGLTVEDVNTLKIKVNILWTPFLL